MTRPRVGIVGPRRVRQGLGPFVARELEAAGAHVPGFVASSAGALEAAFRELASRYGIRARGYRDLRVLAEAESLDAVAILSPAETHAAYLEAALGLGLATLCEKPLTWGTPDFAAAGRRLVAGFVVRGLLLQENCQWPYTLSAFDALHPGARERPPRRFTMRLSPNSTGAQMIGEAMPHALSLLQALAPSPSPWLEAIRFEPREQEAGLVVNFRYISGEASVETRVHLMRSDAVPRQASLELDGHPMRRDVQMPDYRIFFVAGPRRVEARDPLALLVEDFVRALKEPDSSAAASQAREIDRRLVLLGTVLDAYRRHEGATT